MRNFVLITTSLILCCSTAIAKPEKSGTQAGEAAHQRTLFKKFDSNQNGYLTEQEFVQAIAANLFENFDQDQDGKVSEAEYYQHSQDKQRAKQEYPKIDIADKGYIELSDVMVYKPFIEELQQAFRQLDVKNKGYISLQDLPDLTEKN